MQLFNTNMRHKRFFWSLFKLFCGSCSCIGVQVQHSEIQSTSPEPEKFDPRRFEGNEPAPYTYVPFGECAGKDRVCANGNIGVHAQLSEEVQVSNCYS